MVLAVFIALVLFAAFLGLVVLIGRGLSSLGRLGSDSVRQLRGAGVGPVVAVISIAVVACAIAGAIGYGIAALVG